MKLLRYSDMQIILGKKEIWNYFLITGDFN